MVSWVYVFKPKGNKREIVNGAYIRRQYCHRSVLQLICIFLAGARGQAEVAVNKRSQTWPSMSSVKTKVDYNYLKAHEVNVMCTQLRRFPV